jgi:hypothetical protein
MATLVRTQVVHPTEQDEILRTSVPKPFPSAEEREQLLQEALLEELAEEQVEYEACANGSISQSRSRSTAALHNVNHVAPLVSDGCFRDVFANNAEPNFVDGHHAIDHCGTELVSHDTQ